MVWEELCTGATAVDVSFWHHSRYWSEACGQLFSHLPCVLGGTSRSPPVRPASNPEPSRAELHRQSGVFSSFILRLLPKVCQNVPTTLNQSSWHNWENWIYGGTYPWWPCSGENRETHSFQPAGRVAVIVCIVNKNTCSIFLHITRKIYGLKIEQLSWLCQSLPKSTYTDVLLQSDMQLSKMSQRENSLMGLALMYAKQFIWNPKALSGQNR